MDQQLADRPFRDSGSFIFPWLMQYIFILKQIGGIYIVLRLKICKPGDPQGRLSTYRDTDELVNEETAIQKVCILPWITAHIDIFVNEQADYYVKKSWNSQLSNKRSLTDAVALDTRRLTFQQVKLFFLAKMQLITSNTTRLRMKHL